jgi:hypothetical protein
LKRQNNGVGGRRGQSRPLRGAFNRIDPKSARSHRILDSGQAYA